MLSGVRSLRGPRIGTANVAATATLNRGHPGFDTVTRMVTDQRIEMVEVAGRGDGPAALAALREIAVLCARRDGPDGVARWNRDIERALDERFHGLRWDRETIASVSPR